MGIFAKHKKGRLSNQVEQAKWINAYFCNAVTVYALTGERAAKIAALTAAKAATRVQRASMMNFLEATASNPLMVKMTSARLQWLAADINEKDWNLDDILQEKLRLFELNPEFAYSLDSADPTVFERTYPQFFVNP
jgi:hypothetical protein